MPRIFHSAWVDATPLLGIDARDLKTDVVINLVSTSLAPAEAAFLDGAIEYLMRLTDFGS